MNIKKILLNKLNFLAKIILNLLETKNSVPKDEFSISNYGIVKRLNKNQALVSVSNRNEFINKVIEGILLAFDTKRSLSHAGCPYDNAIVEAIYKQSSVINALNH